MVPSNYAGVDERKMKLASKRSKTKEAVFKLLTGGAKTFKDATRDLAIPRKRPQRAVNCVLALLHVNHFGTFQKLFAQKK